VHPVRDGVMAISVVVASLRSSDLVSHSQHRDPSAQEQEACGIFHLTIAEGIHVRIIGLSLMTAVPTIIVVAPVVVPLTVSIVVLVIVRHEVTKSEPVVTGNVIQTCRRPPVAVQVRRALNPGGQLRHKTRVTFDKTTYRVAILTVPFSPPSISRERTDL